MLHPLRASAVVAVLLGCGALPCFLVQSAAAVAPDPAPAEAEPDPAFDVQEFRVLGNTVLPATAIERALYPLLGTDRTLKDVEVAREALATAYRDAGFGTVLVDIPEQSVDEGIVRLQVTEGRLERTRVSGARYFSQRRIRASLPSLQEGEVPHLPSLQADLGALANQSRDRQITPILRSGSRPGSVAVDLKVDDRLPLHGAVEVNDRYTADTSRTRVNLTLGYENFLQRFDTVSLQFQTAPEEPDETQLWALTYLARTPDPKTQLAFYGVRSDSDVAALGTLNVLGRGNIFGARLIRTLDVRDGFYPGLTLGVDYKDFDEDIQLSESEPARTPISYWLWSAQYSLNARGESWDGAGSLTLSFGHREAGNSVEEFAFKRYYGRPNFAYLRGGGSGSFRLPYGLGLGFASAFQYSPRPVVSNEQFSYGGVDSVRGYLESEGLADYGWSGSVELRAPRVSAGGLAIQGYLFTEAGVGAIQRPLPGQIRRLDLSSWGAGVAFSGLGFDAVLDWAYPTVPGIRTLAGDDRWHFSLKYGF